MSDNHSDSFFPFVAKEVEQRKVKIRLHEHKPLTPRQEENAMPKKVEGPQLNATGNEVEIEEVKLVKEVNPSPIP